MKIAFKGRVMKHVLLAGFLLVVITGLVWATGYQINQSSVIRMEHIGGFGPLAGQIVTEFFVNKNGSFTYKKIVVPKPPQPPFPLGEEIISGKMPKDVVSDLIGKLEQTKGGSLGIDNDVLKFWWRDKHGRVNSKEFSSSSPVGEFLSTIEDLAQNHKK